MGLSCSSWLTGAPVPETFLRHRQDSFLLRYVVQHMYVMIGLLAVCPARPQSRLDGAAQRPVTLLLFAAHLFLLEQPMGKAQHSAN